MEDGSFDPSEFGTQSRLPPTDIGNKVDYIGSGPGFPPGCGGEKAKGKGNKDSWTSIGSGRFVASYPHSPILPAGMYSCTMLTNDEQPILDSEAINVDEMLRFKDSVVDRILDELELFIGDAATFKKFGFLHRRGCLLYGPSGGGKTVCVQQIVAKVIGHGHLVLLCKKPHMMLMALRAIREVEPDRFIMCVFEDLDAIIAQYGESDLLSLLDGENQIDHVLNIATSNYPERLDRRMVARPRRFDRVIKINGPDDGMRADYFRKKIGLDGRDLAEWVLKTRGMSFSSLAELVISVKCLRHGFDESVALLRGMMDAKASSSEFDGKIAGFGKDKEGA